MREIKFRGKSVDTDNWVYGDLITLYYPKKTTFIAFEGSNQNWSNTVFIEVIPETVGQYTGQEDARYPKGQEIYEGDIVSGYYKDEECNIGELKAFVRACVKYSNVNGMWELHGILMGDGWHVALGESRTIKVIGNVTENPELLGRKKDYLETKKFLEKEGAWEKWKMNLAYQAHETAVEYFADYEGRLGVASAMWQAFVWDETPEGHIYWSNLYLKAEKLEKERLVEEK